ncbi:GntR family transcriptional regulator [Amycolatopsis sp.]|uniref:GntR family transcriptional regulator n=1 Tax=Amycolatopsis sp. TaxID=37632 RepID=UPI002CEF13B4|nr:GntR family transcriptional regulator [Amycolatopsis sp.]HVV08143.1 GntR family transcriptional regulator [Amycolatopsis sp.]
MRPRRGQLSEEVADHVRELIISGRLRAGEYIRQERIADELGLSATPVREGLLALKGEGFVALKPRRGFVVSPLSAADVVDLFAAQALLAGELVARAATRMGEADLDRLTALHAELREAAAVRDGDLVERLNHEFHRFINLAAEAPRLAWMLSITARFAPRRFFASIPGWPRASAQDHATILAALAEGDSEAAREAMIRHIDNAGALLAVHFDSAQLAADGTG